MSLPPGLPGGSDGKSIWLQRGRPGFDPWVEPEDPWEKEMATHSSTFAWKTPWTEKPGRLQSVGLQRVGHDWVTSLSLSPPGQPLVSDWLMSSYQNPAPFASKQDRLSSSVPALELPGRWTFYFFSFKNVEVGPRTQVSEHPGSSYSHL